MESIINKFKTGEKGGLRGEADKVESVASGEAMSCVFGVNERARRDSVTSKASDGSVAKRKRANEGEGMDVSEIACMRTVGARLRKFVFTETNKVSKSASEHILNLAGEYEEQMMRMICKNERLQGKLDECMRRVSWDITQGSSSVSYASVTAKNAGVSTANVMHERKVNARTRTREPSYAVIVRAKDASESVTSEEVKEKIMRHVSKTLKVRVKAVRKVKNGGVAIETMSENELKAIKECEKFKAVGLSVELPRKIGPKIILYDVPNEIENDVLINELYERNLKDKITERTFRERVRIVSRSRKKDATCGNVIVEVATCVKNVLCEEGRVFAHWRSFRVKEFVSVLRCHKCFAYGHMMRQCSEKVKICQKCGCGGHEMKECEKENECRNCKRRGNKCDHSVLSGECPEYRRALGRERARVNDE